VLATITDAHIPASSQQPRELNDVTTANRVNNLKQVPILTGSAGLFNECALGHFLIFTFPE
jgi:hypothetical protein